tara:strand:- start:7226 stop:7687 length:462 start_codon:yes stop_codon:yes gene_type:complete
MAGPSTGHKMKLYRNTGTSAVPVWSEVDEVGDVSIPDFSRSMAELKRRASDFTKNLAGLIQSVAIEFRLHHGMDATNFDAIRTAFFAGTAEEWAIMNGDNTVTGNEGLVVQCLVEQFPWDQPLEDVSGHDIRLAIAYMEEASAELNPAWTTIA